VLRSVSISPILLRLWFAIGLVSVGMLLTAPAAQAHSGRSLSAAALASTGSPGALRSPATITVGRLQEWIKNLAERYAEWRERYRDLALEVAKHGLQEWARSDGTECPWFLPASYFCPTTNKWSYWGVGYAVQWGGRVGGIFNRPSGRRYRWGLLRPGRLFWLTCYTSGDKSWDGRVYSTLWYRLPGGGYINDAWVETGTNDVVPGVSPCA
jgi:hypothetical protein